MSPNFADLRGGKVVLVEELAEELLSHATGHTGLTISGGEPFEQAKALAELIARITMNSDLDVMCYSGFTLEEIRCGPPEWTELLSLIDILIDGEYREEEPTDLIWRGSENQKMFIISNRAEKYTQYVKMRLHGPRRLHLEIGDSGSIHIIGIPSRGDLDRLKKSLEGKGIFLF